MAGFNIVNQSDISVGSAEVDLLKNKLSLLAGRFPNLVAKVHLNGFDRVVIRSKQTGAGGIVLAAVFTNPKEIVVYDSYFLTERNNEILSSLAFSFADVALLHELIHAFDFDKKLLQNNLHIVGWGLAQDLSAEAFKLSLLPQIANEWVTEPEISKIKNDLNPLLKTQGPWQVYVDARERMKKLGYPTIYSVLGGPVESFAELAAYIVLDPEASDYIEPQSIDWFKKNVLN